MKLDFKELNKNNIIKEDNLKALSNSFMKSYLLDLYRNEFLHLIEFSNENISGLYEYHYLEGRDDALLNNYYFNNVSSLKELSEIFKQIIEDFESRVKKANLLFVRSFGKVFSDVLKTKDYSHVRAVLEKDLKKNNLMSLDKRFNFSEINKVDAKEILYDIGSSNGLELLDRSGNIRVKKIEYAKEIIGIMGFVGSYDVVRFLGVILKSDLSVPLSEVVLASLADLEHMEYHYIRVDSRIKEVIESLLNKWNYYELFSVFRKQV